LDTPGEALGIAVCDADAEVHKLYAGAAVPAIEAAFPGTTAAGKVDRQKLAAALLAEPDKFKRLEAIVHPLVFEAERDFLRGKAAKGAAMAVIEVRCCWKPAAKSVSTPSSSSAPRPRPSASAHAAPRHDLGKARANAGTPDVRRR
jgi:hypothetical protein